MNPPHDPLRDNDLLADVAHAGALVFLDTHMAMVSPSVRKEVGLTLEAIISTSLIAYLERVAQIAQSN